MNNRVEVNMLKKLIVFMLVSTSAPAMAHLTWIDLGDQSLGLSTGHNFPVKEIIVKGQYVESVKCIDAQERVFNLAYRNSSIRYTYKQRPHNCFATLKTSLIKLQPRQGAQHFDENKVDKALVTQVQESEKFSEEYFKTAQIKPVELDSALYNPSAAQFVTLPGDRKTIYIYKNGRPLVGLPVGLEYPETPVTLWSKTDENGKVSLLLQPSSKALLRAFTTEETGGDAFKSQFLTVTLNPN